MTDLKPLATRSENLVDQVFQAIRQSIVNETLPPGSRVSEAKIAAQLNVSKTPIREALLRLRHVGLVVQEPRGLCVVRPSVTAIRDAYELRSGLERLAANYATQRAEPSECEALLQIAQASLRHAEARDASRFRESDRAFHSAVARAARNSMIEVAVADSLVLTSVLRERDVPVSGDSIACAGEHVDIAQAMVAGQADKAAANMSAHILHVMAIVLSQETATPH